MSYTTASFSNISAGTHQLGLSLIGYADTTISVAVPAGGTATVNVALRPLAGTPASITEAWSGYFTYAGPVALGSTGTAYITARANGLSVLAVVTPAGIVQRQTLIADPDALPAFDIALDSSNNAFVATSAFGNAIYVYDAGGVTVRSFARRDPVGSDGIAGIAVGPGDTVHVSARYTGTPVIEKYTLFGVFVYAFPTGTANAGPIEVGTDGSIYLGAGASAGSPQIRKYGPTGSLLQAWAVASTPVAITRRPGGSLCVTSYVADPGIVRAPGRMEVFTAAGVRVAQWAIENHGLLYLDRHGVDAAGNFYLPLRNDQRVLRYAGP